MLLGTCTDQGFPYYAFYGDSPNCSVSSCPFGLACDCDPAGIFGGAVVCLVYQPNGTTSNSWNCNDTLPTPTPLPSLAPTASIVITPTPTQFTSTFFSPTTASPPSPPSPSSPVGSVSLSDIDVISFTTSLDSSRTETIVVEVSFIYTARNPHLMKGDGDEVVIIIIPRGSATNVQVT